MNRYYYYLVMLYMVVNVLIYVPNTLSQQRFSGAVSSMLLSIPLGLLLLTVFLKSIAKFPQQTLPDILKAHAPNWLRFCFIGCQSVVWYIGGLIILLAFTDITKQFLNPDASLLLIIGIYLLISFFIARLKSIKILYIAEILFLLNAPFVLLIFFKTYTSADMNWNAVMDVCTYLFQPPTWSSMAAASYLFSGYAPLIIFNQAFPQSIKLKRLWGIGLLGSITLFTSVFIPIGFHGVDGIDDYKFPWVTTADSIRMDFAPIERIFFPFILMYISIALIAVIVHWHVSLELIKSFFTITTKQQTTRFHFCIFVLFVGAALFAEYRLFTEQRILAFGKTWLNARLCFELCLVATMFIMARRKTA